MNLHLFIARKIGTEGSGRGRMGIISNRIGSISVAVSILIMIVAVAIVGGFKSEIRSKATGFMGSVTLVAPGESPINELYPLSDSFPTGIHSGSKICKRWMEWFIVRE